MAVVSTGFFDGVHRGHRHVIERLLSEAKATGEESVVITFWPHPRNVLQNDARNLRLLTSLDEKKQLLYDLGVDHVAVLPFTKAFSRMTTEEYLKEVLMGRFGATEVVLGYDNRIGSDLLSAAEIVPVAERLGLKVIIAEKIVVRPEEGGPGETHGHPRPCKREGPSMLGGVAERRSPGDPLLPDGEVTISSTKIREALEEGRMQDAAAMLGYPYCLHGVVVAGNKLGRKMGFPTANMQLYEPLKAIPSNGVYAVAVETVGCHRYGMCNIGVRPTIGHGNARTIETHIFDFDEDIYGLDIRVSFLEKIRDERQFESLDALREQLIADREACLAKITASSW